MHDTMSHRQKRADFDSFLDPIHQQIHRYSVIFYNDRLIEIVRRIQAFGREVASPESDAFDSSVQSPPEPAISFKQGKFNARRPAVNGQNALSFRFRGWFLRHKIPAQFKRD